MAQYYYARGGQQKGPIPFEQLQQMADAGQLLPGDLVWTEGMANWMPAQSVAGLGERFGGAVAVVAPPAVGRPGVLGYQTPDAYYPADLEPVSFRTFCGLLLGGLAGMLLGGFGMAMAGRNDPPGWVPLLLTAAIISAVVGWIYGLIILYRAWKLIPPQYARTSPGKAVGFLFIPFFNLYWIFQAYWGLAKDYNTAVKPRDSYAPEVSETVSLVLAVMVLLSNIPVIGGLFAIICLVLVCVFVKQLANAINYTCRRNAR